jgi:hypothetical protein
MEARARFTRMRDGTAEEFALIHASETAYASTLPVRMLDAVRSLETGGAPGYAVNRLEHFAAAVEEVFSRAPSFR